MGILALESMVEFDDGLEQVKAIDQNANTQAHGEYDALHDQTEQDIATEQEEAENASEEPSSDDGGDTVDSEGGDTSESEGGDSVDSGESDSSSDSSSEGSDSESNSFDEIDNESNDESSEEETDEQKESDTSKSDPPKDGADNSGEDNTKDEDASTDETSDKADSDTVSENKDGKQTTVAAESLRNDVNGRLVREDFLDGLKAVGGAAGRAAWGVMAATADTLKELGIKYGPGIIDKVGKTIHYVFCKSAKLLIKTIVYCVAAAKRQRISYVGSLKKIATLKETIALLKKQSESTDQSVTDENQDGESETPIASFNKKEVIDYFRMGNVIDATKSGVVLSHFMAKTMIDISKQIETDIGMLERLIQLSGNNAQSDAVSFMRIQPFQGEYLHSAPPGYKTNIQLVSSYLYKEHLPNGLLFAVNLPRADLKDFEEIKHAYHDASIFLAVDNTLKPLEKESIDYMDLPQLEKFLDILETLCKTGLHYADLYTNIAKRSSKLRLGYKSYYQSLIETKEQVSIRESLVELMHLKQSFISRVYVPAATDIHDYVAAYVVRALSYVRANISDLKRK